MCILLLCWWWIFCLVGGDVEASFLELCEVCLTEHEAVPMEGKSLSTRQKSPMASMGKGRPVLGSLSGPW